MYIDTKQAINIQLFQLPKWIHSIVVQEQIPLKALTCTIRQKLHLYHSFLSFTHTTTYKYKCATVVKRQFYCKRVCMTVLPVSCHVQKKLVSLWEIILGCLGKFGCALLLRLSVGICWPSQTHTLHCITFLSVLCICQAKIDSAMDAKSTLNTFRTSITSK